MGAEKYLQESWPIVKGALKEHGISCELNLVRDEPFFSRLPSGGEIVMLRLLFWLLLCVGGGIHDCFDHQEDQGPLHHYKGQRTDEAIVQKRPCTSGTTPCIFRCQKSVYYMRRLFFVLSSLLS